MQKTKALTTQIVKDEDPSNMEPSEWTAPRGLVPAMVTLPQQAPQRPEKLGPAPYSRGSLGAPRQGNLFLWLWLVLFIGKWKVVISHVWLFATPWTVACQALLSMEFSREEYWSGLPFPSPGNLPNPGIQPHLQGPFLGLVSRFRGQSPQPSPPPQAALSPQGINPVTGSGIYSFPH